MTLLHGVAEGKLICPIAESVFLELTKQADLKTRVRPHAAIPHGRSIRRDHLARPALAHLEQLAKVGHSLPLHDGRHHFFALRSFSIALSSMASARSFFSLGSRPPGPSTVAHPTHPCRRTWPST